MERKVSFALQVILVFLRYGLAVLWGVVSEVCVDVLKRFAHGLRGHEFSLDFGAVTALLAFNLGIVAVLIAIAYAMERFFSERAQKVLFVASVLVTGFFYPPC